MNLMRCEMESSVSGTIVVVRKEQLKKIIFSYWNNLMTCRISCENFSSKLCKNQPCLRREYLSQHLITRVADNLMHFEEIRCNLDCKCPIAWNKYRSSYEKSAISVLVFRSLCQICWEKADTFQKLCHIKRQWPVGQTGLDGWSYLHRFWLSLVTVE